MIKFFYSFYGINFSADVPVSLRLATVLVIFLLIVLLIATIIFYKKFQYLISLIPYGKNYKDLVKYLHESGKFQLDTFSLLKHMHLIGTNDFNKILSKCRDQNIRDYFGSAHNEILKLRKIENEQKWISDGIAQISSIRFDSNDLVGFLKTVLNVIVKYTESQMGAFYITKRNEKDIILELVAVYGCSDVKNKIVYAGDGLIGQAFYEDDFINLIDIPSDFVNIQSGLGSTLPKAITIVPLNHSSVCYGVIELASVSYYEDFKINYLKKVSEIIGSSLALANSYNEMQRLLNESVDLTKSMKEKEVLLQNSLQQLEQAQAEMRSKQKELDTVLSALATLETNMEGQIIEVNDVFLSLTGFKRYDLINNSIADFMFRKSSSDLQQYNLMWESIKSGQTFSGEFQMVNSKGNSIWMNGNFTPILNSDGRPYKVIMVSVSTSHEKEKLYELKQIFSGLKNLFAMAEFSKDLKIKTASDEFLRYFNLTKLTARDLHNLFDENTINKINDFVNNNALDFTKIDFAPKSNIQVKDALKGRILKLKYNPTSLKFFLFFN